MGGRAAEELIFHDPTTGASNDIEKATNLARAMVTQYGMTETLGAIKLGISDSQPFLGRDYGHQRDYSENVAAIVDTEIRLMIENAHQEAFDVLVANRDVLDELVNELLEKETLNKEEIEAVFKKVKKVRKRAPWTGSKLRVPSNLPPVALKPAKIKEKVVEKPADKAVEKPAKKAAVKKPVTDE
jgi:cell division protease FtsH